MPVISIAHSKPCSSVGFLDSPVYTRRYYNSSNSYKPDPSLCRLQVSDFILRVSDWGEIKLRPETPMLAVYLKRAKEKKMETLTQTLSTSMVNDAMQQVLSVCADHQGAGNYFVLFHNFKY